MKRAFVLLIASMYCGTNLAAAETEWLWPRWRGPHDAGSTTAGVYPTSWTDAKNVLWKAKLPGVGCSTPVVWKNSILLTSPVEGENAVLAYDLQGRLQWKTAIGRERPGKHRNGSGSNPSPITDGRRVFAYFKSGDLAGLDLDGKLLWKTNLQQRFAKDTLYWDLGTSPVLTGKSVVVAVMHTGDSFLAAFDPQSGDLQWKAARNYQTPVECDQSYATPLVIERNGREIILVWGADHLTAHAAEDGRLLWSCGGFNPGETPNWVTIASPVVIDDLVIVPFARGGQLAAVRLGGQGDVTATHRVWTRKDTGTFVPTPSVAGGKLFLLRDEGEVACIDPKTGRTLWDGRLPKHRGKYYASPLVADGKLYAIREDGVAFVAKADGSFELLSENPMGERVIASPVPLGNRLGDRLLIRGERHLFCIGAQ